MTRMLKAFLILLAVILCSIPVAWAAGLELPVFLAGLASSSALAVVHVADQAGRLLGFDPALVFVAFLALLLSSRLAWRALSSRASGRGFEGRDDGAGSKLQAARDSDHGELRSRRAVGHGGPHAAPVPVADSRLKRRRKPVPVETEAGRNMTRAALAVGAAVIVAVMIVTVTYLYFGPGYIDIGSGLRIERGPRRTFFLRIGAVFGAVALLHVAYFMVLAGGGALAGKVSSGLRSRRKRRPPRERRKTGEPPPDAGGPPAEGEPAPPRGHPEIGDESPGP